MSEISDLEYDLKIAKHNLEVSQSIVVDHQEEVADLELRIKKLKDQDCKQSSA